MKIALNLRKYLLLLVLLIDKLLLWQKRFKRVLKDCHRCKVEGKENADWILLDFGAVIVHIFKPEVREYYQIEKMWKGYLTETSG